jgi:NhaP-type Na+/H+ or K+/H+ antiporter
MHGESLFIQALLYLVAAVIAVPIAKRLGLGSVLGYLLAGIAIGPFGLGLVGEEGQDVMHFAEFGVVMMLFLVGLELQPRRLWEMRVPVLGMGGAQVGVTAVVIAGIALGFGQPWPAALAIGLTLALSSTAIVLQSLRRRGSCAPRPASLRSRCCCCRTSRSFRCWPCTASPAVAITATATGADTIRPGSRACICPAGPRPWWCWARWRR